VLVTGSTATYSKAALLIEARVENTRVTQNNIDGSQLGPT
jgi:hypothetical protein